MKNRYQIIVAYDDQTCKTEYADDIINILGALSAYLEDPHADMASVWDMQSEEGMKLVFDWAR